MRTLLLPFFFSLFALSHAIYYIDDADKSITYSSSAGIGYSTKWRKLSAEDNGLAVMVDPSLCHGGTASYTQCSFSDDCTIEIPFNGTGIVLYIAQDVGDIYNTTISLDGGPRANHFAYTPPNSTEAYNLSLYEVQGLPCTTHMVNVKLDKGVSRLLFDYAAVTGDAPANLVRSSGAVGLSLNIGVLLGITGLMLFLVC